MLGAHPGNRAGRHHSRTHIPRLQTQTINISKQTAPRKIAGGRQVLLPPVWRGASTKYTDYFRTGPERNSVGGLL